MAAMIDRWAAEVAAVLQVRDALGRGPDAGVVATVAALRLAGFVTVQSCWGHASRGANGPWVHVAPSGDEAFDALHVRVQTLLDGFNTTRRTDDDRRLRTHVLHDYHTGLPSVVRIETTATYEATHGSRARTSRDLVSARRQMTALTTHLRLLRPSDGCRAEQPSARRSARSRPAQAGAARSPER